MRIILKLATLASLVLGVLLLIRSGMSMADRPVVLTRDTKTANVNEAEKYIGTKIKAHSGFVVAPKGDFAYLEPDATKILVGTGKTDKSDRFYFFLVENNQNEELGLVLDAIEISKGMELGGKPMTDDCYVKDHPQEYIFVIGKTVDKHSKDGRYIGRFLDPVAKAWRVDFATKKLVEIPTKGIHCEIDMNIGAD
ncbi:MAG: hypothetical protein PHD65_08640 [Gallionella sp.]|nr:hypothetical protein [Gallionella sp.]